jgi:quercetin dioxygenase-like cupin family protein
MKRLPAPPPPRPDRPASAILHDEASVRIVAFTLAPAQVVAPHRSTSSVVLHVIDGQARFQGEGDEQTLRAGEAVAYAPGELHGIAAGDEGVRFLAVIAPRP